MHNKQQHVPSQIYAHEQEQLISCTEHALRCAQKLGASATEVGTHLEAGVSVTVRMGEVETLEFHREKGLSITAYMGQRKGAASSSDLSLNAIEAAVKAACEIARLTQEDPFAGLPDKEELAFNYMELDLYHPWAIEVDDAIEMAKQCEAQGRNFDPRIINSEGASISTFGSFGVYANSLGFIGHYPATIHSASLSLVAQDKGSMQRDYYYVTARSADELLALSEVAQQAAQRTIARLNGRSIATQKVPVLFKAEVAKGLMGSLIAAISGGNLYRKSSFLLDHLGKKVLPDFIVIEEHPHLSKAYGSAPFDSEGVKTSAKKFIEQGVVTSYVLGTYSARKLGLKTTGNAGGVHNLSITTTASDFKALLKRMHKGLLVTELMGQGINLTTGDYSRGAAGFWIENGEIQFPVEGVTIAGNLRNMFLNLVAVGSDVDARGNTHTGSWLIEQMTVAGE